MKTEERIRYLDFARGLAIIFMIMQHAMIVYETSGGENSLLGGITLLLGTAPAAPVFMLIMGVLFMNGESKGIKYSIFRGVRLIALGYFLNFLRFCVPVMAGSELGAFGSQNQRFVDFFLAVDILQMAGLSLIIMALVRKMLPWPYLWLILAALISILSPFIWGSFSEISGTGLLWGTSKYVWFPIFPWIIYPLVGMFWGTRLLNSPDTGKTIIKSAYTGMLILLFGGVAWYFTSDIKLLEGDYYRSGPFVHMVMLGFVFIWIFLCRIFESLMGNNLFKKMLEHGSRNITPIYFVQWVLIGWGTLVFGIMNRSPGFSSILGILVVFLTGMIIFLYHLLSVTPEIDRNHLHERRLSP